MIHGNPDYEANPYANRTLQLSFETGDVPPEHPEFLTVFATTVEDMYRQPLLRNMRRSFGTTENGWSVAATLRYGANYREHTHIDATIPQHHPDLTPGGVRLTRDCSPMKMHGHYGETSDEAIASFYEAWNTVDTAMGTIAPFALSGMRTIPSELQQTDGPTLEILPSEDPDMPPGLLWQHPDHDMIVVYRPLEQVTTEDGGRGRKFEERVYRKSDLPEGADILHGTTGLVGVISGETVIRILPRDEDFI